MTRDEIVKASRAEGGMFVVIPAVVQMDPDLPRSAKMLYGIITWKCNSYAFTWATNRELGEALDVSAKRVSALLALLEQQGHIESEIEYRSGTREILHRRIYPIMKSARSLGKDTPLPKNEDTSPSKQGDLPLGMSIPPPENAEVICNINKQKENKKESPYSPPQGDEPTQEESKPKPKSSKPDKSMPVHSPEAFEKLWEIYPRKDSRKASIQAWDKLKPDRALCRVMYYAIKRQRRSAQWNEEKGKYIPLFSTWLNGHRWENEGVDLSLLDHPQESAGPIGGWAPDPEVPS